MWVRRPRSFRGPWLKPAATDSGVAGLGRFSSGCSHLLLMHESFTRNNMRVVKICFVSDHQLAEVGSGTAVMVCCVVISAAAIFPGGLFF
jgi:hypothetical protein